MTEEERREFAALRSSLSALEHRIEQLGERVRVAEGLPAPLVDLVYDPQTSGGLLIALPPERAEELRAGIAERDGGCWLIGHVESGPAVVEIR